MAVEESVKQLRGEVALSQGDNWQVTHRETSNCCSILSLSSSRQLGDLSCLLLGRRCLDTVLRSLRAQILKHERT